MAELSGEDRWLEAFANDWDVHSMCGEDMFGAEWLAMAEPDCAYYSDHKKCKCPKHKELRDKRLKILNFSVAYGKSAYGLAEEMGITREEAEDLLVRYRAKYPKLNAFLDECGRLASETMVSRTAAGRRRQWNRPTWEKAKEWAARDMPKGQPFPTQAQIRKAYVGAFKAIAREGKNTPIQGTNADILKIALYLIWKRGRALGIRIVNTVHDEIVTYSPKASSQKNFDLIGAWMKEAGAQVMEVVTMEFEGHIADCWTK